MSLIDIFFKYIHLPFLIKYYNFNTNPINLFFYVDVINWAKKNELLMKLIMIEKKSYDANTNKKKCTKYRSFSMDFHKWGGEGTILKAIYYIKSRRFKF
jgi:hypothetical protein